ncbi:elongation factor Ts [bacterium]|nr:elongation factor Ts [bacterium]
MAEISASLVKELREKTGAGMMECKKALTQAEGNMDAAVKILREAGIAKGEKRAGRTAAEGLVGIAVSDDQKTAAIVEFNCETDFVARNDDFQKVLAALTAATLKGKFATAAELLEATLPEYGKAAKEVVGDLLAKIGEKLEVNRATTVSGDYVVGYIHPPGKIGTMIVLTGNVNEAAKEAAKGIAMHVAARQPRFLLETEIDAATLATEREIAANIARNEGKPEAIIPKIVEGKIKSFAADTVLLNQEHVMHSKKTVKAVLAEASKEVSIAKFISYRVGELATPAPAEA